MTSFDATEPLPSAPGAAPALPPAPGPASTPALAPAPAPAPAAAAGRPLSRRRPPRRRGRSRGVAIAVTGAVAIVALVGGSAYALESGPGASYRTALVTRGTVLETLQRSGTIEPVAQASVAFPMSGTVATVSVVSGQAVTTGQALASLNTTSLEADLTAKQATLAQAQLVVSQAVTADATVTSDTTAASTASTGSAGTKSTAQTEATTGGTSSGSKTQTDPTTLQKAMAVTGAQQQVDQSLQSATAAVQTATNTCTVAGTAAAATAGAAADSGAGAGGLAASNQAKAAAAAGSKTAASAPSTTMPAGAGAATATTCAAAEQAALTDQQNLASAETSLAQAEAILQGALTTSSATVTPAATSATSSSTSSTSTPSTQKASTSTAANGNGNGSSFGNNGGSDSSSGVTSAAQLVADQAAVDADQAQVTAAQQSLAQATIVSPINGTVASVGVSAGQSVNADSSTDNVIVVGQGGWEVATTVPVANIANVKVGDAATVLPDGFSKTLAGQVVQIGVAATTSGATTTYRVTIGFNNSPSGLGNGTSATVTIDTAQASQALTVPTSAVHSAGGFHYVTTLSKGTVTNTPIQIGAMGNDRTVVTGGLTLGQEVVLAVLNAPLPASNTAAATSKTGLGGATGLGSQSAVSVPGNFTFRVNPGGAGG